MTILLPQTRIDSFRDRLRLSPPFVIAHLVSKYGEAGLIAEREKIYARQNYCALMHELCHGYRNSTRRDAERFSAEFWNEYELINRRWIPEDPVYSGTRLGFALTTTDDFWTLTSPASGLVRIVESYLAGEAAASAVVRLKVQTSTVGTTPTNQTPEKFNSRSPASASTFAVAWATDPTLSGQAEITHTFNAFGGFDRWIGFPGREIYLVNGEQQSARSDSGTSTVSGHVIWEEL